MVPLRNYYF